MPSAVIWRSTGPLMIGDSAHGPVTLTRGITCPNLILSDFENRRRQVRRKVLYSGAFGGRWYRRWNCSDCALTFVEPHEGQARSLLGIIDELA